MADKNFSIGFLTFRQWLICLAAAVLYVGVSAALAETGNLMGGHDNLVVGLDAGRDMTTESGCIVIGDGAQPHGSYELVIRFEDGTEFRAPLPHGKKVDLRSFKGGKPLPIVWMRPSLTTGHENSVVGPDDQKK